MIRHAMILALLVTVGCSNTARMKSTLASRATFDLGCQVETSQITEIDDGAYGVEACGCRATYVSYPGWTLNSVSGETCQSKPPVTSAN